MGIAGYVISSLIYYQASKTNGFDGLANISWIPIINVYSLFLLAKGDDDVTVHAEAKKNVLIYAGFLLVSFIPFIGLFAYLGVLFMFCISHIDSSIVDLATLIEQSFILL
ncbi:hypothetical protein ACFVT8_14110 [Lysinibacillus sp. NPDC058147]|uniref:hypothetical protein n=1 Tax=unclassified Lysinibacillus TaxID=2636778 RepID=UPI0036DA19A9